MPGLTLCPTCLRYWRPEGLLLLPQTFLTAGKLWTPWVGPPEILTDPWVASLSGKPVPPLRKIGSEETTYLWYEGPPFRIPVGPPYGVSHRVA